MNAGRFRHLRTPQIDRERLGNRLRDVVGYAQSIDAREQLQPALDRVGDRVRRRQSHRRRNAVIIVVAVFAAAALAAFAVHQLRARKPRTEAQPPADTAVEPTEATGVGETNGATEMDDVAEPEVQHAVSG